LFMLVLLVMFRGPSTLEETGPPLRVESE